MYLVAPRITISDYLFFCVIDQKDYIKADAPIAIYDTTGLSQSRKSTEQKFIIDYLVNQMPKYKFSLYFHFYYAYAKFRRAFPNFLKRSSS